MVNLVLLRHGESVWNRASRFTGWTDVGLSEHGEEEARAAGRAMRSAGLTFDRCHTSVLRRAIKTLWLSLEELDLMWLPVHKHWRLNERHYGALQGLDKVQTAREVGEHQVFVWRRSYEVRPPALDTGDERYPGGDPRYRDLEPWQIPRTESLKDTVGRVLPYWEEVVVPELKGGLKVLISAHGNSLRALVKHLDGIADDAIPGVEIPTGKPLLYELDGALQPASRRYLTVEAPSRLGKEPG